MLLHTLLFLITNYFLDYLVYCSIHDSDHEQNRSLSFSSSAPAYKRVSERKCKLVNDLPWRDINMIGADELKKRPSSLRSCELKSARPVVNYYAQDYI